MSSSLARLTRQFATQLTVTTTATRPIPSLRSRWTPPCLHQGTSPSSIRPSTVRGFATDRKKPKDKKAAVTSKATDDDDNHVTSSDAVQPFLQNQEWIKFQQSIRVDGFQTGQTTTASILKKSKGGKQARNRKAKELARFHQHLDPNSLAASTTTAGGGGGSSSSSTNKLPALRYSPEETEELLQLAFRTLPTRDGKRGTRNLKRQARRWKLVRNIRSKYKQQLIDAHARRMEHRQWKREQTKLVKNGASDACQRDADYQAQILTRWANTIFLPSTKKVELPSESGTA